MFIPAQRQRGARTSRFRNLPLALRGSSALKFMWCTRCWRPRRVSRQASSVSGASCVEPVAGAGYGRRTRRDPDVGDAIDLRIELLLTCRLHGRRTAP